MEGINRLTWFGGGLADVGIEAGTALRDEADKARARALMDGAHPVTGEQFVRPKRAAHPASKLVARRWPTRSTRPPPPTAVSRLLSWPVPHGRPRSWDGLRG
ncbi:hypothetical protein ACQEU6_32065 [Spirillospora sp. CA-108201]